MVKKIRIDIADDHRMVLAGLQNIIASFSNMEVRHTYTGGKALLAGLKHSLPDVLLLDIQMPDITGEELVPTITQKYPGVKILVMTGFDSTFYVKSLMRKGAHGYLLKNASEISLKQAIESVHTGSQFIDPSLRDQLLQESLHPENKPVVPPRLTRREKEILTLIMQEKTSQQVADTLHLSIRTVENQRVNLMQKLDVKNAVGLVKRTIEWALLD